MKDNRTVQEILLDQGDHDLSFEECYVDGDWKLNHIPDVAECRSMCKTFKRDAFYPNVFHVNDHGNVDLLSIGWNGAKIIRSWV